MSNLPNPPAREKYPVIKDQSGRYWAEIPQPWIIWFNKLQGVISPVSSGGLLSWLSISKTGSNLTDLETRNHEDLQNINSSTYTHLTAIDHLDLTDGGETALHKHDHAQQNNMNSANFTHLTAVNHTDLTDGGNSELHYHDDDRVLAWMGM